MKKTISFLLIMLILTSCSENAAKYKKYSFSFMDTFDTVVQMVGYAKSKEEFDEYAEFAHNEFSYYHKLFDKYNSYEGINNVKTINDNAGIEPVAVDKNMIELIKMSKEWYTKTNKTVNIAYGAVLEIWHNYRDFYQYDENGKLPSEDELEQATLHTDIEKVIVDEKAGTVFLAEKGMSLDVGAIAKGFATEMIGNELFEKGLHSFIISSGGNVRVYDAPKDKKIESWGIGIEDPLKNPMDLEAEYLDIAFINNKSFVTSGNYIRYYTVDGKKIHHIIDTKTNFPANNYSAVTVLTENSGVADITSTALYIMNIDEGKKFAAENNLDVMWVYENGEVVVTDGLVPYLKNRGKASNKT
ncbi:MAG: FAD:protein FMN transferase [Oscillospiraceae bacterium]